MNELELNKLEAENYTREQYLNKVNKRVVNNMMQYVRSCPINNMECEVVRKKIIELAEHAQNENKEFMDKGNKNIKTFCDMLIAEETGRIVTHKNSLRNIGNIYYYIFGILGIIITLITVCGILAENFLDITIPNTGELGKFTVIQILQQGIYSGIYIFAGRMAKKRIEKKAGDLMRFAIVLIFLEIGGMLLSLVIVGLNKQVVVSGAIHIICAIIYKQAAEETVS